MAAVRDGASVIIPTRDHRELLRGCLESLLAQTPPLDEILVVDNGSADGTAEMVRGGGGRVRLVREERRGVHHARNRGIAEARGEILLFTDDDVLAPPGWSAALRAPFSDPEVTCAGGPTRADWESPPPPALLRCRRLLFCLGVVDFGERRRRLDPETEFFIGANMACRKRAVRGPDGFRGVFPFGPCGVCGEDYELSRRLARTGAALYEPAAWVRHHVPARKTRWDSLARRLFAFAAARARLGGRLRPRRGPAELLGLEGAVSAVDALGHLYGRLSSGSAAAGFGLLLFFSAGVCAAAAQAPSLPRNVIFISIDTLRPDHAGCYGYRRPTTPRLDAFAGDAVLFERCISAAPWTMPSHMSMFTSLYPNRHGLIQPPKEFSVMKNLRIVWGAWARDGWAGVMRRFFTDRRVGSRSLSRKAVTLPEILKRHGYRTGGFTAAEILQGRNGFGKGFDRYDNEAFRGAPAQNRLALEWLRGVKDRPFFLFLHYYDAHGSFGKDIQNSGKMGGYPAYGSPGPGRGFFDDGKRGRFDGSIRSLLRLRRERSFGPVDVRTLHALYDEGVRYTDGMLGEFLGALRELGVYDDSVILITSDHGEELLGERGEILHNDGLTNTLLQVAFLLKLPGGEARGRRVSALVRTVDYLPTVLEAAGIAPDRKLRARMQGTSLLGAVRTGRFPPLQAYSEVDIPGSAAPLKSLQTPEGWKLLHNPAEERTRLFFLPKDPLERVDLSEREPERAGQLLEEVLELGGVFDEERR